MVGRTSTLLARTDSKKSTLLFRRPPASDGWYSLAPLVEAESQGPDHKIPDCEFLDLQTAVSLALDKICDKASDLDYTDLTIDLMEMLRLLKASTSDKVWRGSILPVVRGHEITRRMHQCPFTKHSFSRPRGYPGDAELLDFVYQHADAQASVDGATPEGRTVLNVTVNVPACGAVRRRKEVLAHKIDEIASGRPGAEVLAVACGHLREAESSIALQQGGVARFVATDQDEISLRKAASYRDTISTNIDVRSLSVRNFIAAKHGLGTFDLVYAAGLYDYLDARLAARLTGSLFALLKTGGRLLIPNFLTGVDQEAYMEACMDWYLIYRTREQIEAFSAGITKGEEYRTDYFEDETCTIGYLEVQRV